MRYLNFNSFPGNSSAEISKKIMQLLIPAISQVAGRDAEMIKKEIQGPVILPIGRIQSDCVFEDKSSLNCEIRICEGMLIAFRCFSEILSTQFERPSLDHLNADKNKQKIKFKLIDNPIIERSSAVNLLEKFLERFWLKPDDPLGMEDFWDHRRKLSPDYIKPVASVISSLHSSMDDEERREWARYLTSQALLFTLTHEIGHYVVRAKNNLEIQKNDLADKIRKDECNKPFTQDDSWPLKWAEELMADMAAIEIVVNFSQTNQSKEISKVQQAANIIAGIIECYSYVGFTLCCTHLFEYYGYVRLGRPPISEHHPTSLKRRDELIKIIPKNDEVPITLIGETVWTEMEMLFSEVLSNLDNKGKFSIKGKDKAEVMDYFSNARNRLNS